MPDPRPTADDPLIISGTAQKEDLRQAPSTVGPDDPGIIFPALPPLSPLPPFPPGPSLGSFPPGWPTITVNDGQVPFFVQAKYLPAAVDFNVSGFGTIAPITGLALPVPPGTVWKVECFIELTSVTTTGTRDMLFYLSQTNAAFNEIGDRAFLGAIHGNSDHQETGDFHMAGQPDAGYTVKMASSSLLTAVHIFALVATDPGTGASFIVPRLERGESGVTAARVRSGSWITAQFMGYDATPLWG